jgi:hypothetical protein
VKKSISDSVGSGMILSDPDPTFQLVSDPDLAPETVFGSYTQFSYILGIIFTIVFLPCECVRLLII